MTIALSLAERRELAEAIGAERAQTLQPTIVRLLGNYAAYHGEMSVVEAREHAVPLLKALDAAAKALDAVPDDLLANFYWPDRLADALGTAAADLIHLCNQAPKHRDRDTRRMLVLTHWGERLAGSGVRLSEYEGSPFARALRVALLAMDRVVKRRYRGRPPTHDTMQPTVRAVKRELRQRAARAKQWEALLK